MTSMAQIELEHVDKHYGQFHALKDINLTIPKGSFVALVGPSGCGKSTLLRSLAGLESISGGTMKIAGERMNVVPPRRRDVAMVFQSYALYPHMTVRQETRSPLREWMPSCRSNGGCSPVARSKRACGRSTCALERRRIPRSVLKLLSSNSRALRVMSSATDPELTIFHAGRVDVKSGETVGVSIAPKHVHLFDPADSHHARLHHGT